MSARFIERFDEVVGVYYNKSLEGYSNKELIEIYESLEKNILDDFVTPITNDMATMVVFGMLTETMKKYRPKDYERILSEALKNEDDVESVKQATDLIEIVKKIRENKEWLTMST